MRAAWIAALVLLALAGCTASREQAVELSAMNADQLAATSDKDLCNRRAGGQAIEAERRRRGLADCGAGAIECKQSGYAPGSQQYLQCRQIFVQQEQANRDRRARILSGGNSGRVVCRKYFDIVQCDYE